MKLTDIHANNTDALKVIYNSLTIICKVFYSLNFQVRIWISFIGRSLMILNVIKLASIYCQNCSLLPWRLTLLPSAFNSLTPNDTAYAPANYVHSCTAVLGVFSFGSAFFFLPIFFVSVCDINLGFSTLYQEFKSSVKGLIINIFKQFTFKYQCGHKFRAVCIFFNHHG